MKNPIETGQQFQLTMRNPNPKARLRKDGMIYLMEVELTKEDWDVLAETNLAGVVFEAVCQATHQPQPRGGALSKLAGRWCADGKFQAWAASQGAPGATEADARLWVCDLCDIGSRAELDNDDRAKQLFEQNIRQPYMAYLSGEDGWPSHKT